MDKTVITQLDRPRERRHHATLLAILIVLVDGVPGGDALRAGEPDDRQPAPETLEAVNDVALCGICHPASLRCDQVANGELAEGDCRLADGTLVDPWAFEIDSAREVNVSLTSTDFDAFLILLDEACEILARNDDCVPGEPRHACISMVLAPGRYLLAVNSFDQGGRGRYRLGFECRAEASRRFFRRGDVDASGELDINDPVSLLGFEFLGLPTPPCLDAADYNDDGVVDISDSISNLVHQFLSAPAPAPPGEHSCGPDPTPDDNGHDLECAAYPEDRC